MNLDNYLGQRIVADAGADQPRATQEHAPPTIVVQPSVHCQAFCMPYDVV